MRAASFAALALLLLAAPARAEEEIEDPLYHLNKKLQDCIARLPRAIAETPTSDAAAVKDIRETVELVKPRLPRYRMDERYGLVTENLANLEGELASIQAGSATFALINEINNAHMAGNPVPDERLQALGAAAAQFKKVVNERWRPVADGYVRLEATLRQQNADIRKQLADIEREKQRQANEARRQVVADQARKALDRFYFQLKAGDRLVPADLAQLKASADELEKLAPGSGRYYQREQARIATIALWEGPDEQALPAVAQAYGATLVAKGVAKGNKLQVSFAATEDWCYLVTGRFAKNSGADRVLDFAWSAKEGRPALQAFELMEERGEGVERGFCATKAAAVSAAAKLEMVGKTNALRWAVLGWERAKFPAALATRLWLDPFDHCDVDHWKSLWMRPVPGTVAWRGREPFLLLGEEGVALDMNGARTMLRFEEITSRVPAGGMKVGDKTLPFIGCARRGEPAWTADSKAVQQCTAPLDRKYAKLRAEASRGKGPQVAEAVAKLEREYDAETAQKCGKLEHRTGLALREAIILVSKFYFANPPADTTDRLAVLQARLGVKGPEAAAAAP